MPRYVINTPEIKVLKKIAKKYGNIPIKTSQLDGQIQITSYRKYQFRQEVDVIFRGKIFAYIGTQRKWYDQEEIVSFGRQVSKMKLNRFLKKSCFDQIRHRMHFFGVELKYITDLTKVKWTT